MTDIDIPGSIVWGMDRPEYPAIVRALDVGYHPDLPDPIPTDPDYPVSDARGDVELECIHRRRKTTYLRQADQLTPEQEREDDLIREEEFLLEFACQGMDRLWEFYDVLAESADPPGIGEDSPVLHQIEQDLLGRWATLFGRRLTLLDGVN